jgi:hypothetical protein
MAKKKTAKIQASKRVVETKGVTDAVSTPVTAVAATQPAEETKPAVAAAPVATKSAILESANIVATPVAAPSHEAIARRAYEVYRARNGRPGNAWGDWCQAERELLAAANAQTLPARAN